MIFDKAVVRCVAFKGTDKRFIIDDKFFGGSLYSQYIKAIQWLKEKINVSYDIEGQGSGPRKEIWEIPETVFKEAIINSLSHRDYYDKGATTVVELYDDRVEISNPGGLLSAIKPADFGKRSLSRNPLIFGLFARMQLVEQVGSGIIRMNDLMKEAGLPVPEFATEGMFTITLQRHKIDNKIGIANGDKLGDKLGDKTRAKIVEILKTNNQITIPELAELLNVSYKGVEYHITEMKKDGILRRIGSRKNGSWEVTDK